MLHDVQSFAQGTLRPSMAATLGKLTAQARSGAAESATSFRSGERVNMIGGHTFGMDPERSKYYNRTEHGTYLIREALNQRSGTVPSRG